MNKVSLIGNITQDIELKQTPNGKSVVSVGIATNEKYKDQEGIVQTQTEFHNLVAWGNLAEVLSNYVNKGDKIYIEGKLTTRSWEAQDGSKRYKTEILVREIELLGNKKKENFPPEPHEPIKNGVEPVKNGVQKQKEIQDEISIDDIPFR